ncbi:hypothetical protein KCP78_25730 [Salmonella enterica subsp. enterica]|nr:hypothetical protein KCP78_25730 [Salmonella enterica subsp. enterica]
MLVISKTAIRIRRSSRGVLTTGDNYAAVGDCRARQHRADIQPHSSAADRPRQRLRFEDVPVVKSVRLHAAISVLKLIIMESHCGE